MILITLILALIVNVSMFIPAYYYKTDKLTDISYALTVIGLVFVLFFTKPISIESIILSTIVIIWALRLGIFLLIRIHAQKKDSRFDKMRESFLGFLGFWIFQGVTAWAILIPLILFNGNFVIGGVVIWLIGLVIESVADGQKFAFKQNPKNKGEFIRSGLWNYSRHPNYFGEILCWIGVYVAAGVWLWGLMSPIYIASMLLFFSGIPLLEKKADEQWGDDKTYRQYKKNTSLLIPWFK